ncbi:MAG: hypothetical protein D6748_02995 [Calditrichaeota bacterium]|nr:MAG: hypothetical protein D6748_02995 [Calditrichota bacterium]
MPKWYKADVLIIIPEVKPSLGLSEIIGALPFNFGYQAEQQGEKYITLLNSRQVVDALIDTFALEQEFDFDYRFQLREYIRKEIVTHEFNPDGSIRISVIYPDDKEKPAEMTNFLVRKIDDLNKRLNSQHAHYQRVFLEQQTENLMNELHVLEDSLAIFQEKFGIFDVGEQLKGMIELLSKLEFERIKTDVSIRSSEKYMSTSSPEVERLKDYRAALDEKIDEILHDSETIKFSRALQDIPGLSLTYFRLLRDVKIKEKILEFLIPQLESAKVEEVKNTPSIQVIDPAIPAEYKYKPKRAYIVIGVVFFSLFLHFIYLWLKVYIIRREEEDAEFAKRLSEIKRYLSLKS